MKKNIIKLLLCFLIFGCKHQALHTAKKKSVQNQVEVKLNFEKYELKAQVIQKLIDGRSLNWGGFSGLSFIEKDSAGDLFFWTLSDRGPNGDEIKKGDLNYRQFLFPEFHPSLVKLRANKQEKNLEVIESIPLKKKTGEFFLGLPPVNDVTKKPQHEIPLSEFNEELVNVEDGIDPESLAIDSQRHFWVGEEYLPSLLEFDPQGTLLARIEPASQTGLPLKKNQIPFAYKLRKINRGFEALSIFNDRLYFMLQSPLDVEDKPKFIRIGVFNIKSRMYEAEYLYPVENPKSAKIGDMQMIDAKRFLVIEQNNEVGPESVHQIFEVNLSKATNTLKAGFKNFPESVSTGNFPKKFIFAEKTLAVDLVKDGYADFEKVEGLTLIDAETLAVINDNDFGVKDGKIGTIATVLGLFHLKK